MRIGKEGRPSLLEKLGKLKAIVAALPKKVVEKHKEVDPPSGPELRLSPVFTRVAGDCFEIGDKVGVFMFYPEADDGETDGGGDGPYIDNKEFTCRSGSGGGLVWDCGETLRWKDGSTPADFICYHPYSGDAAGKDVLQCRVMSSQSSSKALSVTTQGELLTKVLTVKL